MKGGCRLIDSPCRCVPAAGEAMRREWRSYSRDPYPDVQVHQIPSGVRAITGVATSITAFVGRTRRGPVNTATTVHGFADYERIFGGLWPDSTASFAVRDFFTGGGERAVVVRLVRHAGRASWDINDLLLEAVDEGSWANTVEVTLTQLDAAVDDAFAGRLGVTRADLFNLVVRDPVTGESEVHSNVTVLAGPRRLSEVLSADSRLLRTRNPLPAGVPAPVADVAVTAEGVDGEDLSPASYTDGRADHQGLYGLDGTDLFNLLCIPPPTVSGETANTVYQAALEYCVDRRAVLIVDAPDALTPANGAAQLETLGLTGPAARNAAMYYPRILVADPTSANQIRTFVGCGAVAGVIARTDATRGMWKAPAGIDANLAGTADLAVNLTDDENAQLNPLGINCLRSFPLGGPVVWGARTLRGADMLADEYKYLPVRRLALHIEESLLRGTQWVVSEPNDETLWAQIRLNVGAFLQSLFSLGAFQGSSPRDAYFVKCDHETTDDVDLGRVNIGVGFAPLRPAEFVVLQIQQIARAEA